MIIRLTGGLGNQLFQYTYGRSLSIEKNEELFLDTSWYKGRISRYFMLDLYNVHARKASWFRRVLNKKEILQDLDGSWHNEKFFKENEETIRKELTLKNPLSPHAQDFLKQIQSTNSVSLHLRGGDYVRGNKSSYHGTCSREYYEEAVRRIRETNPDVHFFIFTDDLPWAREHIEFPTPHTIVSGNQSLPDEEELALMSACKHNIIANSTFSWWAAWLNPNKSKIIVAPKKWFADETANEKSGASGILRASWIQI